MLLGPPASGKGTQAELIQVHLSIPAVSPGAVLREEARVGSELGKMAEQFTSQGRLVPDDVAVAVVEQWLIRNGDRFVFDGFPRSLGQAELTDTLLEKRNLELHVALLFEVDEETSRRRILQRRVCYKCDRIFSIGLQLESEDARCPSCGGELARRPDDNPETLARRMVEYREQTLPVVSFYEDRDLLVRVDSSPTPDQVFQRIKEVLQ